MSCTVWVESEDTKTFNRCNHGPCVEDRNAVSRVDPNASIDTILSIFFIQLVNYQYKSKYRAKKSLETIGFSCCEKGVSKHRGSVFTSQMVFRVRVCVLFQKWSLELELTSLWKKRSLELGCACFFPKGL